MPTLNEQRHPCGFALSEGEGNISRENLAIAAGQKISAGQVLGRRAVLASAAAIVTPVAGNVGDGPVAMDPQAPVRPDVEVGSYQVEFITGGATAEFNVLAPNGRLVGTGAVGTPFAGPIKFSVVDDAAKHYAPGDRVQVGVTVGAYEHGALDPAATDGLQNAVGLALYPADTTGPASYQPGLQGSIAGLMRMAEVIGAMLVWPAGMAPAAQAAAVAQLGSRHILVR